MIDEAALPENLLLIAPGEERSFPIEFKTSKRIFKLQIRLVANKDRTTEYLRFPILNQGTDGLEVYAKPDSFDTWIPMPYIENQRLLVSDIYDKFFNEDGSRDFVSLLNYYNNRLNCFEMYDIPQAYTYGTPLFKVQFGEKRSEIRKFKVENFSDNYAIVMGDPIYVLNDLYFEKTDFFDFFKNKDSVHVIDEVQLKNAKSDIKNLGTRKEFLDILQDEYIIVLFHIISILNKYIDLLIQNGLQDNQYFIPRKEIANKNAIDFFSFLSAKLLGRLDKEIFNVDSSDKEDQRLLKSRTDIYSKGLERFIKRFEEDTGISIPKPDDFQVYKKAPTHFFITEKSKISKFLEAHPRLPPLKDKKAP